MNFKYLLTILFSIMLISCAGESEDSDLFTSEPSTSETSSAPEVVDAPPTLASILVYSDKVSVLVGEEVNLVAYGRYSDLSFVNITNSVTWSSANDSVATVSGQTATAVGAGSVQISANLDGVTSSLFIAPFSANITSIELNYTSLTLPSDGEADVTVSAIYDNGMSVDVTDSASFTMQDTAVATVDDTSNKGKVVAVANGSTQLDVSYDGQNATLPLTITTSTISSIQATPIVASKALGESQQFYSTATLDDATTLDVTGATTWSSSDTSILELDSSGLATLKAAGVVTVTADYQGFSSSVTYTVLDKTLDSLTMSLSGSSLSVGVSGSVTVIATYSDASTEDVTQAVTYSSSDNSVAIISNNNGTKGNITSLAVGSSDLTATLSGVSTTETLTVTAANLVSIAVTTNETLLSSGINAYFTATWSSPKI